MDFEKYFCSFSKNIFFQRKKSCDFFWITISMWNFVRNPFFASINATEQFWRPKTTSETSLKKCVFEIFSTSSVVFSISPVANSKPNPFLTNFKLILLQKKKRESKFCLSFALQVDEVHQDLYPQVSPDCVQLRWLTHMYPLERILHNTSNALDTFKQRWIPVLGWISDLTAR